ncbi:MAG TPA: secondary thiamine-phosphate synthase [Candidatus Latescibacteria bacterium]|nr:secondary thiamine-phosphate synthase [Candidatus Latescibacterota bacterium]
MAWMQKQFTLSPKSRGFHLVTHEIANQIPELASFRMGLAHIFICHTSASLTINENAAPDVRHDFEQHMNNMVPENQPYYRHTDEGADDMPAHIKASMMDSSLSIPITNGCLNMGTWQGIYLCEHRNHAAGRKIIVTLQGET